ncbi:hypothetical protein CC80DRAFT_590359 [Byssothecium circinans]|uniref:Uncharacterized protein n=1 Tax=Byssothecium circinans TaxID=147558 RepID=A0A6A5U5B2_9PLEO|nr:hypothetical protein CC80DRAFT_590359 [Byssothecium circinans]
MVRGEQDDNFNDLEEEENTESNFGTSVALEHQWNSAFFPRHDTPIPDLTPPPPIADLKTSPRQDLHLQDNEDPTNDADPVSPSSSDLSSVPSDLTARGPPSPAPSSIPTPTPTPSAFPSTERPRLANILATLEYAPPSPLTIKPWKAKPTTFTIHNLPLPLPHPQLTPLQNQQIHQTLYNKDLTRLVSIYPTLPTIPRAVAALGAWEYEHFGRTLKMQKRVAGMRKLQRVMVRGIWRFRVQGQNVEGVGHVLDEFPLDGAGETVGWAVRRYEDWVRQGEREGG